MAKHHKNKPGGQTKPKEELAIYRIGVSLNQEENAKVERYASTFKISKSEVLRRTLARARLNPPIPIEHKKLVSDVGRLGHNVNQIARGLNTLHARIDVAEKHRVKHDVSMNEVLKIAQDAQETTQETLKELRIIRAILMDNYQSVRGQTGGE